MHCISLTKIVLNSTNSGSLPRKEPLKELNRFFVQKWCYRAPQSCQRTAEEPLKNHWSTKIWCYTQTQRAKEPLLVLYSTICLECMYRSCKLLLWWFLHSFWITPQTAIVQNIMADSKRQNFFFFYKWFLINILPLTDEGSLSLSPISCKFIII